MITPLLPDPMNIQDDEPTEVTNDGDVSECSMDLSDDQQGRLQNQAVAADHTYFNPNPGSSGEEDIIKLKQIIKTQQTEVHQVKLELEELKTLSNNKYKCIENDDKKSSLYTGLSWTMFLHVFNFLVQFINLKSRKDCLPLKDQLFVTLVKLKINPPFEFLACEFSTGKTTILDIFKRWINLIYMKLSFIVKWPDTEAVRTCIPPIFKSKFPCLTCIIDCFEIFIDAPKGLKAKAQCYSNYKKHSTVKFFIACTPLGSISFLSKAWGGRASDIEIVRDSGFISASLHMPGDQILADRGFLLHDDIATVCCAELITPSFTKGKKQLSTKDVEISRLISSVCIHIERIIGLMKNKFNILQGPLPIRLIKSIKDEADQCDLSSIDKIVNVCAILTNLGNGIVYDETKKADKKEE